MWQCEDEMIQQGMPFVAEQIEMENRRIIGIPMEQRPIQADGMVVEPTVLCVEMESIERTVDRRTCHDLFIRLKEAGVADTKGNLPATVVLFRGRDRNRGPIEPAENQARRFAGL